MSFKDTNFFVELQKGSSPTINAPIDDSIADGQVASTDFGLRTLDYIPSKNRQLEVSGNRQQLPQEEQVEVITSDKDYVSSEENAKRMNVRERIIEQSAQNILKEYDSANQRFLKAKAFVLKYKDATDLPDTIKKRLQNAQRIVKKGIPMTIQEARKLAVKALDK